MGSAVIAGQMESDHWLTFSGFFEAAGVTVFGFVVLAIVSAALGYVISGIGWRYWIRRKRTKRLRQMEARLNARLEASGS